MLRVEGWHVFWAPVQELNSGYHILVNHGVCLFQDLNLKSLTATQFWGRMDEVLEQAIEVLDASLASRILRSFQT